MKTTLSLLSFASLALAAVGATTATTPNDSEITLLPTYRVETARYTPAEKAIEASLAELRATAKAPAAQIVLPAIAAQLATDKANVAAAISKAPAPANRLANN
ncbi:MAG TPA: hypothetical protein VFJ90_13085 [Candidatus Didemnitutus sp.]|nr:hypothetical protein [Candidatus Didemnitutus sp.]